MSEHSSLLVSHTSTVTPDQIDELGHMNVRWYGANAHAGTQAMCERLDIGDVDVLSTYTRHHHEQMEGNKLEVRSAVLASGSGKLRLFHELRNQANNDLAATFVHVLDHAPVESSAIEIPDYGQSRSIDLSVDRLHSAPSLDELRGRGLAMRQERTITTEDSMGADVVPSWLGGSVMWNGESLDGQDSWITETADGDRVAFASMETQMHLGAPVPVGTRIQSFGAAIAVGSKITHDLNWVFDLDSNELLIVAETIDLSFSIPNRRSREIPAEVRKRVETRLHPDLA